MRSEGEPFSGVEALFNGDLYRVIPEWAPREDWLVLSPEEIVYIGQEADPTDDN